MVVITYFFNTFDVFGDEIWVILSNSKAFFGSVQAFLETFNKSSILVLFLADGCYNLLF